MLLCMRSWSTGCQGRGIRRCQRVPFALTRVPRARGGVPDRAGGSVPGAQRAFHCACARSKDFLKNTKAALELRRLRCGFLCFMLIHSITHRVRVQKSEKLDYLHFLPWKFAQFKKKQYFCSRFLCEYKELFSQTMVFDRKALLDNLVEWEGCSAYGA